MKLFVVGLFFIVCSFYTLFSNESDSYSEYNNLQEGRKRVISVPADSVDPNNNGKLVHVTGYADTQEILRDPMFGVQSNLIRLQQKVSVYQWIEDASPNYLTLGLTAKYTYKKEWSDTYVNSGFFKFPQGHDNESLGQELPVIWSAKTVKIGAFTLSDTQISQMNNFIPIQVNANTLPSPHPSIIKPYNGGYYVGNDPTNPQVGDVIVTFGVIYPGNISIIAEQSNNTFEPYHTSSGTINIVKEGVLSATDMFTSQEKSDSEASWEERRNGFGLMVLGVYFILDPLVRMMRRIPKLRFFTESLSTLPTPVIALFLTAIIIGITWSWYHYIR